jgi:GT2 family glycosyltransferase
MKLSIITVTWNNQDQIKTCIESVRAACKDISFEHIIVDNGSTDQTLAIIRSYSHVHVLANEYNAGFGRANNMALADATGEYILFLNGDMELAPGSLDTMVAWMNEHPDVGLASPKLVDEHGNLNLDATPRRFPRTWEQVALVLKLPHLFPHLLDGYHMRGFDADKEQDVDSVRGAFMLLRRDITDTLGWGFDPRYFIWYEDVDTCREVWAMGKRVVYTPVITAVDYVGQSFKQRTSIWKQQQFTKSMLQYFQKWEPWCKWMWIWLARPIGIGLVWVSNLFYKK